MQMDLQPGPISLASARIPASVASKLTARVSGLSKKEGLHALIQKVTLSLANLTHPTVLPALGIKREVGSMTIASPSGLLHLTDLTLR